ncbi:hypothetical protein XA68_12917 [Ophiocordyceps unilateralis]|uniref:Uncharacterized protein n=1 Tax=Ophiocordyceps unilateralis TaxID=268505 RepID=A0A2A9PDL3_OPHUN|nr:hypothetical protein XA68_12917 [Ophiocordyceps unilateralis]
MSGHAYWPQEKKPVQVPDTYLPTRSGKGPWDAWDALPSNAAANLRCPALAVRVRQSQNSFLPPYLPLLPSSSSTIDRRFIYRPQQRPLAAGPRRAGTKSARKELIKAATTNFALQAT